MPLFKLLPDFFFTSDSVKIPRQAVDGTESSSSVPQTISMDVTGIRPQPIGYGKEADGDRKAGKSPERVGPIQVMLRPLEDVSY